MMIVRQITDNDIGAVVELALGAGHGLTSLPKDEEMLRNKLVSAVDNFNRRISNPGGESYLFVMEDTESGRIVGTSGIVARTGGFEPFYTFSVETEVVESKVLGQVRELEQLTLVKEHDGPCEIGSLYISPKARHRGGGRLLSLCRFLYMAEYPERFTKKVIAEMRGVVDEEGISPFWESVGKHFFRMEFPEADLLSAQDKSIIAELIPSHPIYICLLPDSAKDVLGKVHPFTEPALHMLMAEGFHEQRMVDIFDAGPVIGCELKKIRSVEESCVQPVVEIAESVKSPLQLISVTQPKFTVTLGNVAQLGDGVVVSRGTAELLNLKEGTMIRYVSAKGGKGR